MKDNWPKVRAKFLFQQLKRPCAETDGTVTAFRDGEVILRSARREDGFTEAVQYHGYQGVKVGDLVIHSMDGFAGAIGVSKSDGKMSPVAHIYSSKRELDLRFYSFYLRHLAAVGYIQSLAKGIRERSTSFDSAIFAQIELPVPPLKEQKEIAEYLIDLQKPIKLIENEEVLMREYIGSLLDSSFDLYRNEYETKMLRGLITQNRHYVSVAEDSIYDLLGVRWYGEGAFIRESVLGTETSASKLQKVLPGSLIYNRLFAWKESFAVVGSELEGTYASGEFPMFTCRPELLVDFLNYYLLSPRMTSLITLQSQGASSISRSRWNESELIKLSIPLPGLDEQVRLINLINYHKKSLVNFRKRKELQSQLVASVTASLVTGEFKLAEMKEVVNA